MNTQNRNAVNRTDTIDLLDLFRVLLGKWMIIVACAVIGAALAFVYSRFLCTPQYSSTSKIYILSKATSITTLTDIQIGNQLTSDYLEVAKDRPVLDQVIKNLGLNLDYKELGAKVTVSNPSASHMIYITVKDSNPEMAKVIVDEMADVISKFIGEMMDQTPPNVLSYGYADGQKVSPTTGKNVVLGGLLGGMLAVGLFVMLYILNDKIQGPDDFGTKMELQLIGTLPMEEGLIPANSKGIKALRTKKKNA